MATKAKKADTPHAGKKRYIALRRIANRTGDEVWNPGAELWLDDAKAALYVSKGIAQPADETVPPAAAAEPVTIHEAKEGATDGNANSAAA